jgi:drug/metabolite transporter (DMT)-like permease
MIASITTSIAPGKAPEAAPGTQSRVGGVALGITAAVTYAVGPVLMKVALDSMSVWTLLLWRTLLAAVLLWILLAARGALRDLPATPRGWLAPLAVGAVAYGGQIATFALALQHVSASMATIIFHTAPIVVLAAAVLGGRERFSALRLLAVALAVGGVAVVAAAGGDLSAQPLGVALSLASAVACAAVILGIDRLSDRVAPLPLAVLTITGCTLAFLVTAPLLGVGVPSDGSDWLLVVALAAVPGVIGTTALLGAIGVIGPSLASILLTLEPPITVLLAWVALDERLTAPQLVGAAAILAATVLAQRLAARPLEVPPA